MNIFYYANQVYQYSNAKPIYARLGGTFIVKNRRKLLRYLRYMRNSNLSTGVRTFLNVPPVIRLKDQNFLEFEGVIFSQSNTRLRFNPEKCSAIFIGHGTGDKKYGGNPKNLESYSYHFVSGQKHLEKMMDVEVRIPEEKLVKIGNIRFDDYVNGNIDREAYLDRLGVVERSRKNVLYAPTWRWGKGTLQKYIYQFCREITPEFNLIVRPHFHDRTRIARIKSWVGMHRIKHVYFSNPADIRRHDTMDAFAASDLLISDTSSIMYDYLITGNPIIVIKTDFDDLHKMPDHLDIRSVAETYDGSQRPDIVKQIRKILPDFHNKAAYAELLHNCFFFNDGHSMDRVIDFLNTIGNGPLRV